jgi:hypothetical protein
MSLEPSASLVEEVERLFPNPQPARGCGVCTSLYKQRLAYMNRKSADYSPERAAEMTAEIRNHPHGR